MTTPPTTLTGPYGRAEHSPPASYPEAPATLTFWLITSPRWHPAWSQYALCVVSLADIPGVPTPVRLRPKVTHELLVLAADPTHGPYTANRISRLQWLTPVNIANQFTATDEEAIHIARLCAQAVLDGRLNPETGDAPATIRMDWAQAIRDTLAHPHHTQTPAPPFTCPRCTRTSHHPKDKRYGYCGQCHDYTGVPTP